jgi:hypothetical protein
VAGLRSHIHLQRRNKRLLRNIHLAELAHALLAFLLLPALACDFAADFGGSNIN